MALPLILHYSLNKTDILKTNHNCEKGMLKSVTISIESLFFLTWSQNCNGVCTQSVPTHVCAIFNLYAHTVSDCNGV